MHKEERSTKQKNVGDQRLKGHEYRDINCDMQFSRVFFVVGIDWKLLYDLNLSIDILLIIFAATIDTVGNMTP